MTHNKFRKTITVVIVLLAGILVCIGLISIIIWLDKKEVPTTTLEKYYTIDPETILYTISRQNEEVFTPAETFPELEWWVGDPVSWSQADYWQVADAVHQHVWNEHLEDFEINYMDFTLNCEDVTIGYRQGRFGFFKVLTIGGRKSRVEHEMIITPRDKSVAVWETTYYPYLVNWKKIDKNRFIITADDALKTAEKAGGLNRRTSVENDCYLYVSLYPGSAQYKGWRVVYQTVSGRDFNRIFTLWIDPYTGKIK